MAKFDGISTGICIGDDNVDHLPAHMHTPRRRGHGVTENGSMTEP